MKKIPIRLKVIHMQADVSEFRQRSAELEPINLEVVVELEDDREYFAQETLKYWEELQVSITTGGKLPELPEIIVLTPTGLAEVRRIINDAFVSKDPQITPNPENHNENPGWDDDEVVE